MIATVVIAWLALSVPVALLVGRFLHEGTRTQHAVRHPSNVRHASPI